MGRVDPEEPGKLLQQAYRNVECESMLNRMMAVDMRFTLADNDLRKVNKACEAAGVEAAYPMLDDAVIGFAGRLPPQEKVKGTELRHFFKWAFRDLLPREIQTKKKHGFGLPFGIWLTQDSGLRDLTFDSISSLKNRGIVRPEFIEELVSQRHAEHAAYYGTMIWLLMMLEQWMSAHEMRAA